MDPYRRMARLAPEVENSVDAIAEAKRLIGAEIKPEYGQVMHPHAAEEKLAEAVSKHGGEVGAGTGRKKAETVGKAYGPGKKGYKKAPKSKNGGDVGAGTGRKKAETVGTAHGPNTKGYKAAPKVNLPAEAGAGGGAKKPYRVEDDRMEDDRMARMMKLAGIAEGMTDKGAGPKCDQHQKVACASCEGGEVGAGTGRKKSETVGTAHGPNTKGFKAAPKPTFPAEAGAGQGAKKPYSVESDLTRMKKLAGLIESPINSGEDKAAEVKKADEIEGLVYEYEADRGLTAWERMMMAEGRKPYEHGTARQWYNGTYIKTADGWFRIPETKSANVTAGIASASVVGSPVAEDAEDDQAALEVELEEGASDVLVNILKTIQPANSKYEAAISKLLGKKFKIKLPHLTDGPNKITVSWKSAGSALKAEYVALDITYNKGKDYYDVTVRLVRPSSNPVAYELDDVDFEMLQDPTRMLHKLTEFLKK